MIHDISNVHHFWLHKNMEGMLKLTSLWKNIIVWLLVQPFHVYIIESVHLHMFHLIWAINRDVTTGKWDKDSDSPW